MENKTIKTIHDYEYLSFDDNNVFRGQSNEYYSLLPSAYRDTSCIKDYGPKLEIECVQRFIQHLFQKGYHSLPGNWIHEDNIFTTSLRIFPTEDMLPYLALAQHYASDSNEFHWLKTSLLDVTYALDIAAYFAVKDDCDCNGKVFVLKKSTVQSPPYGLFEPHMAILHEARMVVQNGALIYKKQEYQSEGEMFRYKESKPFDDIILGTIIIPNTLKEELKEHLRIKLFDSLLLPKLILRQMTPDMLSFGIKTFEEIRSLHKADIDRAEKAGNRHSDY